jgi:methanogenic corrinoid protein MtbC1
MKAEGMISDGIYRSYLDSLLKGDRGACLLVVQDMLTKEVAPEVIYRDLFQRSLYEVGELWESNRISVAVEHMATAITELLIATVYPAALAGRRPKGKRAVVSCSANEFHQVGARIVADTMDIHGWDVAFLGANTPARDLLTMIENRRPDVLGLSLSIYFNLSGLTRIIEEVRHSFPQLDIILGGQAFRWGGRETVTRYGNIELIPSLETLVERLG